MVKLRGKGHRAWVFARGAVLSRYATAHMTLIQYCKVNS